MVSFSCKLKEVFYNTLQRRSSISLLVSSALRFVEVQLSRTALSMDALSRPIPKEIISLLAGCANHSAILNDRPSFAIAQDTLQETDTYFKEVRGKSRSSTTFRDFVFILFGWLYSCSVFATKKAYDVRFVLCKVS